MRELFGHIYISKTVALFDLADKIFLKLFMILQNMQGDKKPFLGRKQTLRQEELGFLLLF